MATVASLPHVCPKCGAHHRANESCMPSYMPEQSDIPYRVSRLQKCETEEEFRGIHHDLREATDYLLDGIYRGDYQTPPMFELYMREISTFYSDKPLLDKQIRMSLALDRDITDLLDRQVYERRKYSGNIVLEWTGPTGMGKSSCMLAFMEKHNGLLTHLQQAYAECGTAGAEAALKARLSVDVQDLPNKLDKLQRGDAVALDEQFHLVGEGARTAMDQLANAEESLRGTGIDIHFASPSVREHTTSQGILRAISVSPQELRDGRAGRMEGLFLYSIDLGMADAGPIPLGVVRVPWCSKLTFDSYTPWKNANLERTKRMQFGSGASDAAEHVIKAIFENAPFRARLSIRTSPDKADVKRWLRRVASSMSIAESDAIAGEIVEMLHVMKHAQDKFRPIWGFDPSPAMLRSVGRTGTTIQRMDE